LTDTAAIIIGETSLRVGTAKLLSDAAEIIISDTNLRGDIVKLLADAVQIGIDETNMRGGHSETACRCGTNRHRQNEPAGEVKAKFL